MIAKPYHFLLFFFVFSSGFCYGQHNSILSKQEAFKRKQEQNSAATKAEADFLSMIHTYLLTQDDTDNIVNAIDMFANKMVTQAHQLKKTILNQNTGQIGITLDLGPDSQKMLNFIADSALTIQNTGFVSKPKTWKTRTLLFFNNCKALLKNITSEQSLQE